MRLRKWAGVATAATLLFGGLLGMVQPVAAASNQPNIVGGSPVSSAPSWAASLRGGGYACSGVLVDKQWVMTAAHCSGMPDIRIGSKYFSSGGVKATAVKSVASPDNDIRLYKLSKAVSLAPLQRASSTPASGAKATLYGFGQTCPEYDGCGGSEVLKSVGTTLTSDRGCAGIDGAVELCFDTNINATDCYGDSGGPAVVSGKLVGITSRGAGDEPTCGKTNSIYGDVVSVADWVNRTIGS